MAMFQFKVFYFVYLIFHEVHTWNLMPYTNFVYEHIQILSFLLYLMKYTCGAFYQKWNLCLTLFQFRDLNFIIIIFIKYARGTFCHKIVLLMSIFQLYVLYIVSLIFNKVHTWFELSLNPNIDILKIYLWFWQLLFCV